MGELKFYKRLTFFLCILIMLTAAVDLIMWLAPPSWEEDCRKKDGIPSYAVDTKQPICMLGPFDMEQRNGTTNR